MEEHLGFRARIWLPVAAAAAGVVMVALAAMAIDAVRERYQLVLDGRVLRLAHKVETLLREEGLENVTPSLQDLLRQASPEVRGMILRDSRGEEVTRLGLTGGPPFRNVEVFLGPGGRGGPPSPEERARRLRQTEAGQEGPSPYGPGPPWARGAERRSGTAEGRQGRGRYTLRVFLDRRAGRPPLSSRLILPAAIAGSAALLGLALVAGRLLDRQRELMLQEAQQRRLEVLGRAGAGLAHQLRTPLATIKGSLQMIVEEVREDTAQRRAHAAIAQAERMERMLGLLLDFARPPAPELETVDVAALVEELASGNPALRTEISPGIRVIADPEHLLQILENLTANALAASPEGSPVEITVFGSGSRAVFIVADRGPGPGEDPETLFEPYLTRRADGTGLGLPIARNLAEVNGGSLHLRERQAGGTEAVLELPRAVGTT